MFESHSQAIYELLRDERLVPIGLLNALNEEHRATGKPLADLVIEAGAIEPGALLRAIADSLGCEHVMEPPAVLPAELVEALPGRLGRDYGVVPLRSDDHGIHLLARDPFALQTNDDLAFALGRPVRLAVCEPARVDALIRRYYGKDETSFDELLRNLEATAAPERAPEEVSVRDLESMAAQVPIVRFVDLVLGQAVRDQASDIHFEPFEREFKIRYRIDGVLHEMAPPPKALALPITSRVKVLADLDIAERRAPQDGRIKLDIDGRAVDLRVSTLPTEFGESVVLRVLDKSTVQLDLQQLGMPADVLGGLHEVIRRPNGIFIVTGPTGSGKTTTLYSALREISTTELKVLTAEDPVEYELPGVMQVPVRPQIGLTFASALRSFLRQDPDVIMVGEIRDLETARIAIQAALTGHLVFSTLHTNDATGAITRLIDMGIEPFLIASTVEAVLAQRLVRRLCPRCRKPVRAPALPAENETIAAAGGAAEVFERGDGCAECGHTGYRGRRGIFEWLRITDPLRELISAGAAGQAIRGKALELGMRSLCDDGLRLMHAGETTVEEVARYT